MKEVYGAEEYAKHNEFDFVKAAEKPHFMVTPVQGPNECGFYMLKLACIYDGLKFVQKIANGDVSTFVFISSMTCLFCLSYQYESVFTLFYLLMLFSKGSR